MITEIIFGIIIVSLLGYIVWKDKHHVKERRELLNAVLSKTSIEFATANKIDTPEDKVETPDEPDVVDQSTQSDEEFFDGIEESMKDSTKN